MPHPTLTPSDDITIAETTGADVSTVATTRNCIVLSTGNQSLGRPECLTGVLDRSSCEMGASARLASFRVWGRRDLNENVTREEIAGTQFAGRLVEEMEVGGGAAVVPTITCPAWIFGVEDYLLVDDKPFPTSHTVGDPWRAW